ncbi:hypothetical protein VTI28DRAFT_4757 [Corynascus sepedonium]
MDSPDQSISNGTCFYARGKSSNDRFIPCGNVAFGNIHCCQAGDTCLEDSACYNGRYGTTYLAGCTDIYYEDTSCPNKTSWDGYPWAGLIYCRPNQWVACEETAKPSTISTGDDCTCNPDVEARTAAFIDGSIIGSIAILPTISGGRIEWLPGHLPTAIPTSMSTSSVIKSTSTPESTLAPSPTHLVPTSTPFNDSDSSHHYPTHLTIGMKVGIGIGCAIGVILLFGALSAVWVVLRRRRGRDDANDSNNYDNNMTPYNPGPDSPAAAAVAFSPGQSTTGKGVVAKPIAEMPSPEVPPPRSVVSSAELPANTGGGGNSVWPWSARPELQGDVSPPTSPLLTTFTASSGGGGGLGGQQAGSGTGASLSSPSTCTPAPSVAGERGYGGVSPYQGHGALRRREDVWELPG